MRPVKVILISVIISVALMSGGFYFFQGDKEETAGDGPSYNFVSSLTATEVNTEASDAVQVLDANSSRRYVRIENVSDTAIYITFGATTSVDTLISGIRLNTVGTVGSVYVIDSSNLYNGAISATSTAASKTLLVIEE